MRGRPRPSCPQGYAECGHRLVFRSLLGVTSFRFDVAIQGPPCYTCRSSRPHPPSPRPSPGRSATEPLLGHAHSSARSPPPRPCERPHARRSQPGGDPRLARDLRPGRAAGRPQAHAAGDRRQRPARRDEGARLDARGRRRARHQLARAWYESEGFVVEDTSGTCPYDLRCTKGDAEVRVEVKGTRGDGSTVEVTIGEVVNARGNGWRTDLFIVSRIEIVRGRGI